MIILGVVLGAFQTRLRSEGRVDFVTSGLRSVLQPLTAFCDNLGDSFDDFGSNLRDGKRLRIENQRLKDEQRLYETYMESEDRMMAEIENLRGLLALDARGKTKVYAEIIGATPFDNQFMINVGSDQGIRVNLPVVTSRGLLGVIGSVEKNRSQVLLLAAPSVSITGLIQTKPVKVSGLIKGAVGGRLTMTVLEKAEIAPGTEVTTSGYSENIPRDIPIGTVLEVQQNEQFGENRAYILPYARFSMVQEVAVLK